MKLVTVTLLLAYSALVLAFGMPHLEISRQQARFALAYHQVKQIKAGALPVDTIDPWGSPFTIVRDDRHQIVSVLSLGPNRSTGATGPDVDDVTLGMASPPHQTMMRNRQIQFFVAIGLAAAPWIVFVATLVLSCFRRPRTTSSKSGTA